MAITAQMVKELREKTGAGMMDCKKALVQTDGDFEAAIDFLREKGLAAAGKKADRIAAEGTTYILENGNEIKSFADLKGKTIYATGQGANPEYVLN